MEKPLPYWLAEGTELCTGCMLTYVREMEYRCHACDRGYCIHCVVQLRDRLEWLCTECHAPPEEER